MRKSESEAALAISGVVVEWQGSSNIKREESDRTDRKKKKERTSKSAPTGSSSHTCKEITSCFENWPRRNTSFQMGLYDANERKCEIYSIRNEDTVHN